MSLELHDCSVYLEVKQWTGVSNSQVHILNFYIIDVVLHRLDLPTSWLTFSPYELFENTDRLELMNFVLIIFALGPVMAILAGIAFDTLPLVYNVPSSNGQQCVTFATQRSWAIVHSRWHLHG